MPKSDTEVIAAIRAMDIDDAVKYMRGGVSIACLNVLACHFGVQGPKGAYTAWSRVTCKRLAHAIHASVPETF